MVYINQKAYKKMEPHLHVSPVSMCARMTASETAEKFAECGFEAVVLTNHYSRNYMEVHGVGEREWLELYLEGYHTFKAEGEKLGIEVFLGAEVTLFAHHVGFYRAKYSEEFIFQNYADYLVYGITEDFLKKGPLLCDLTLPELSAYCRERGALLLQAHPFRTEQLHSLKDLTFLDGIEMNANEGFPSGPCEEETKRLAKEHGLIVTCGGDIHYPWTHLRSAMYIPAEIHDSLALAAYLKKVRVPLYSLDEADPYAPKRPARR